MVGLKAERLSAEERSIFKDFAFGGFILYKHNLMEPEQIVALCRSLWDLDNEHPPFIAIDQEGGRVHRLPAPFTHFPAAALIGEGNDADLAYRLGRATADELALAGINLNFAPVLDVNSNPQNPVIGDRSFASDPARVIQFSDRWTQGLRDGGIIPCGKHFPGHGDTDEDSHLALPIVERSLDELRATEFPPFIHACRSGIEALMTAHVLYPSLDPKFPATLSHAIITGLLREQLGYDGVVFSDDMEMKAIRDPYGSAVPHPYDAGNNREGGPEPAALLAVRAGVDVLLYGHKLRTALRAFEWIASETEHSGALQSRMALSYHRVARLKKRFLRTFTGVTDDSLAGRLMGLGHQQWVDALYGNL